jgi:hypothetical protein
MRTSWVVSLSLSLSLSLSGLASRAAAQSPELQPAREALAVYDLEGDRTIRALRDLERASTSFSGAAIEEARFLRVVVALDLAVASRVDPDRASLLPRVADTLGVPRDALWSHLRSELEAMRHGVYRAPASEALSALSLLVSLDGGRDITWGARGVRRDLLLVGAAGAALAAGELAAFDAIVADPCAPGARCAALLRDLDLESRRRLAAAAEVGASVRRIERASTGGDALALALRDHVRADAARAEAIVVRPAPTVPEAVGMTAGDAEGAPARPDRVVIVSATEVRIARPPSYGLRDGQPAVLDAGDDALPGSVAVALPSELRPIITPIEVVVGAMRARDPGEQGTIAVGVVGDVPAHVLARVVASIVRAGRSPSMLVRRAPDGTLRSAPIALLAGADPGTPGDVIVRVRLGGFGVARGRGRELSVPRVRNAAGALVFDQPGMVAAVTRAPRRRTILDAMGSIPARELIDAAFQLARTGEPVILRN